MPLIGSHATVTGGLATGGLRYAAEVGAEVIQVFVSGPRGWAAGEGDAAEDARLRESGMPARSASCSRPCPVSRSSSRHPAGRQGTHAISLP